MSDLKKKDLIDAVASKAALKRSEAKEAVEIVLTQMADAMAKGDTLILHPFGKLQVLQSKDVEGAKILKAKIRQPKKAGADKARPAAASASVTPAPQAQVAVAKKPAMPPQAARPAAAAPAPKPAAPQQPPRPAQPMPAKAPAVAPAVKAPQAAPMARRMVKPQLNQPNAAPQPAAPQRQAPAKQP